MTSTSSSKAAQFQATIGAMATAHDPLCCRTCATESFDRASLDCSGGRLIGKFLRSGLKLVNQVAYPLRKRLGDSGIEPAVKPFGQEIREIRRVGSAPCTADAETRKLSPLPDHRDK